MNHKESDDATHALEKLQQMIDRGELVIFTPDEAKALQEVATIWGHIKSVVVLGGYLGNGLKWAVMIVALWIGFKSGVLDWIKANTK